MTARHYLRNGSGTMVEITDRILRESWEAKEQAEEGSVGMWTIVILDPAMDFDTLGHRLYVVEEDASTLTDNVIVAGFTGAQEITRGTSDALEPLGRVWSVEITDINALWGRRVMIGSDCKRPAETDVARMQWLLGTSEAAAFDDVTTYVSTAGPVNMDAVDYRQQSFAQVADDCAQHSGKNWFAYLKRTDATHRKVFAWYGADSLGVNVASISLSNDPTDWTDAELLAGTSLVWPISMDTKLRRDPGRVYDGISGTYDKGALYRRRSATSTAFGGMRRDMSVQLPNVKTKAKADARLQRMLVDMSTQDERITTSVKVPAALASGVRSGMRIAFKASHFPAYTTFQWCRILNASPKPVSAGTEYEVALELSKSTGDAPAPFAGDAFAALLYSHSSDADPHLGFSYPGGSPPAGWYNEPIVGPMQINEVAAPYRTITPTQPMEVRIEAEIFTEGIYSPGQGYTFSALVNGAIVGSVVWTSVGGGFEAPLIYLNLNNITLAAGDVVGFQVVGDGPGWANILTNETFFRVGRGSISMGGITWVGP